MAIDRSKFLARFVDEARVHCARLTEGLLVLEKSPLDSDTVNSLFRSAHTIKGSARMMKLSGIGELAHGMEDLLDAVRGGRVSLTTGSFELLLKCVDSIAAMLDQINTGHESPAAPADLCYELKKKAICDPDYSGTEPVTSVAEQIDEKTDETDQEKQVVNHSTRPGSGQTEYLRVNAGKLDELIRLMGEIISDHNRFRMDIQNVQDTFRITAQDIDSALAILDHDIQESENPRRIVENYETAQNNLRQAIQIIGDGVRMQEHLFGELRDATLELRMIALSTVFEPLTRNVRDLARDFDKEVDFIITGGDTELDRKICERIGDSLLHMIRNALDHGLEPPVERIRSGKSPKGRIELTAFYHGGGVTIALHDDGRGLDQEKIRNKALSRHLFDAATLEHMSRAEINNLIFLPGFSTSPIITDLSGRGVGMDVVRQNIVNELKGSVTIETQQGKGTSFFLHLPLNLAVCPLFIVQAAGMAMALPETSIVEMLTVSQDDIIEIVGKQAFRLREQIIPVERLAGILKLEGDSLVLKNATLMVVRDGENKFGLLVDEILGREEMVVKPLPEYLKQLRIVTGGTIGQGNSIINVLHVPELMRLAGESTAPVSEGAAKTEGSLILVVDDSINTREIEKSILEAYGYTVETADDGQEALEKTRNTIYDLIITDVEMPRLDGFSLTEKLRSDPRYLSVPIIIVTSLEKDIDKKRGIMAGADAYIVKKAFDQSNLLDTIRNLIGG
ncbi:hybrid sensor histidine kinase/response regulator [Desulforegula conservatrix]|uniref:hybrid sensor histidine kinase/response regulator n=1 Tax=Desulforegula conservatrix TaxID=153026 RepID=UPI000404FD90|nr:hybrid sensor histidine kinase/response regulator [Desulforegula conservatrix]